MLEESGELSMKKGSDYERTTHAIYSMRRDAYDMAANALKEYMKDGNAIEAAAAVENTGLIDNTEKHRVCELLPQEKVGKYIEYMEYAAGKNSVLAENRLNSG